MPQPFPYPENITGVTGLFTHASNLTNGFLGIAILVMIAVITFITAKASNNDKAVGFSMFITLLSALLLMFMGLIDTGTFYIVVILFVGAMVVLWNMREQETP